MLKTSTAILLSIFTLFKSSHAIYYCIFRNDYIFAQDSTPGARGTYLGKINSIGNQESITSHYGGYGVANSPYSIWNKSGAFGNQQSNYSAFNPLATLPPMIWRLDSAGNFTPMAYLSMNKRLNGTIASPDTLYSFYFGVMCGDRIPPIAMITLPDLFIDSISSSRSASGDSIIFTYRIINRGGSNATAFSITVEVDGVTLPKHNFPSLNRQTSETRSVRRKVTRDTTSLFILVDKQNLVEEDSEENNLSYLTYLTPPFSSGVVLKPNKVFSGKGSENWVDPLGRSRSTSSSGRAFQPSEFVLFSK